MRGCQSSDKVKCLTGKGTVKVACPPAARPYAFQEPNCCSASPLLVSQCRQTKSSVQTCQAVRRKSGMVPVRRQ